MFAVRRGNWKLIQGRGSGGFTKPRRLKVEPGEPAGQLYDLADDPREQRNVWNDHPKQVDSLIQLLDKTRAKSLATK